MNISINNDDLKRIIKACKPVCGKEDFRPVLQFIRLSADASDGTLTAMAGDGYALVQLTCTVAVIEGGSCLIDPVALAGFKLTKGHSTTIVATDKQVTISSAAASITLPQPEGEYPRMEQILSRESGSSYDTVSVWVNPRNAARILGGLEGDIELRVDKNNPLRPIYLRGDNQQGIIMPVRMEAK